MQEAMTTIPIPLAAILAKLGALLALSIFVERLLVALNWLMNKLLVIKSSTGWDVPEKKEAEMNLAVRAKEESDILSQSPHEDGVDDDPREVVPHPDIPEDQADSRFDIIRLKSKNEVPITKEFFSQMIGTLVAIAACYYTEFSAWAFVRLLGNIAQGTFAFPDITPQWWEYLVTGIIIGSGSKPVHFLMNFIISRKFQITREDEKRKPLEDAVPTGEPAEEGAAGPTPPPAKALSIEKLVGFEYEGGVKPETPENTHLRPGPIEFVVYHHTAMNSESPFEEVVNEFLVRKGWLTGYHTVVTRDGTIHNLCRWDRFGNHAKGYNSQSISVALHGNFETDPQVPFSNHDGRYGIVRPTAAQVDAASRIVALWILMYNIRDDFMDSFEGSNGELPRGILPHYALAQKACPGGNFPYDRFQTQVKEYLTEWKQNPAFATALQSFEKTPMTQVT